MSPEFCDEQLLDCGLAAGEHGYKGRGRFPGSIRGPGKVGTRGKVDSGRNNRGGLAGSVSGKNGDAARFRAARVARINRLLELKRKAERAAARQRALAKAKAMAKAKALAKAKAKAKAKSKRKPPAGGRDLRRAGKRLPPQLARFDLYRDGKLDAAERRRMKKILERLRIRKRGG